jgi:proteasome lid subunit RPN8/RPN11
MLTVTAATVTRMRDHATRDYPAEACGLLLGPRGTQGDARITEARPITNRRRDRAGDRYELEPREHLQVQRAARQAGLEIVGVYHSHPDAAAAPSATDRARAVEIWGEAESWAYLIVPVHAGRAGETRAWVLSAGRFTEQTLTIAGESDATP